MYERSRNKKTNEMGKAGGDALQIVHCHLGSGRPTIPEVDDTIWIS